MQCIILKKGNKLLEHYLRLYGIQNKWLWKFNEILDLIKILHLTRDTYFYNFVFKRNIQLNILEGQFKHLFIQTCKTLRYHCPKYSWQKKSSSGNLPFRCYRYVNTSNNCHTYINTLKNHNKITFRQS